MSNRLVSVFKLIDEANAADPSSTEVDGKPVPNELLYGQRMSAELDSFHAGASEELKIACHAQHLERWKLPRSDYPMDKPGYYAWRNEQKRRHGERVAEFMAAAGYSPEQVERVGSIIRKEALKHDPDAQAMEDVVCLVFLQYYAEEFASRHDEEKMISILQKTWRKMSDKGQEAALALKLPAPVASLVAKALG